MAAQVSFWSLSFDHWRVSSDCYCAAYYGGRFIICSLEIEISPSSPSRPSLSNLSLFVCDLYSTEATINSGDQIFPRYVGAVDLNPISRRFPSMTRWCPLSLVTGECVFEMRNCLWGMSVSQRSERRAESDAASARKGKDRLLREVGGRDAL